MKSHGTGIVLFSLQICVTSNITCSLDAGEEKRNHARVLIDVRDARGSMDKIGQMSSCSPRLHAHLFFPSSVPTACSYAVYDCTAIALSRESPHLRNTCECLEC